MDRLWASQKSLDSEASEFPWQKIDGNCGQAVGPSESSDSEASERPGQKVNGHCWQVVGLTEKLRL